jgi:hypothetical protein
MNTSINIHEYDEAVMHWAMMSGITSSPEDSSIAGTSVYYEFEDSTLVIVYRNKEGNLDVAFA